MDPRHGAPGSKQCKHQRQEAAVGLEHGDAVAEPFRQQRRGQSAALVRRLGGHGQHDEVAENGKDRGRESLDAQLVAIQPPAQQDQAGDHDDAHKGRDLIVPAEEEAVDAEYRPLPFFLQKLLSLPEPQKFRGDEQQKCRQGPEIVDGTHLPQHHLTEDRQVHPEQAEACRKNQGAFAAAEPVQKQQRSGEHRRIDHIENDGRQEHEHLGQAMGDQPSVHLVAVGVHGFEDLEKAAQGLFGQEIQIVGKIVAEVVGQEVQRQHQQEDGSCGSQAKSPAAVQFLKLFHGVSSSQGFFSSRYRNVTI